MMNQQSLVSIALCVYNGERYLPQQLDSIFAQDYPNIEVIAVDDGSTDKSTDILESYSNQYNNLTIYQNDNNLGYVKNFEKAITLTNGEYIALADQDDIWSPYKISTLIAAIGDNILIYHDSEFVGENGQSLNQKISDRLNLYQGASPLPFVLMNSASGHTMMFKRWLIEYALPFEPLFFHDWWLVFVAANVGSIKALPAVLVKYRQHNNNTVDLSDKKNNDKLHSSTNNQLLLCKDWITHCSKFNGRYAKYLTRISNLISAKISFFGKIELFYLLAKHRRELYFINKTPERKQLKIFRRMVFGLNEADT